MNTKKIEFIENPESFSDLDMNAITGGVSDVSEDCNGQCVHCSGSSSNQQKAEDSLSIC